LRTITDTPRQSHLDLWHATTPLVTHHQSSLQPGEHFLFWNEMVAEADLHPDGYHGLQAPSPTDYKHRLWQSGSIEFIGDIDLGKPATCVEEALEKTENGATVVATTRTISQSDRKCLVEVRALRYTSKLPSRKTIRAPEAVSQMSRIAVLPTEVMLFRYAALTSNRHRIHYDKQYTRSVEGYPNLLVQGSLNVNLLLQYLGQHLAPAQRIASCSYKMLSPCYVNEQLTFRVSSSLDGKTKTRAYVVGQQGEMKLQLDAVLRNSS
jgi:3-methylfumaryl-CoA hydratase